MTRARLKTIAMLEEQAGAARERRLRAYLAAIDNACDLAPEARARPWRVKIGALFQVMGDPRKRVGAQRLPLPLRTDLAVAYDEWVAERAAA